MKAFTPPAPLRCLCQQCAATGPANRQQQRARALCRILFALALFWAFPGRWLLAALWAALSHLIAR